MHVLVTGGTGVVGKPAVDALLQHGHTVRLFSRHADRDRGLWKEGVEARKGSIGSDAEVRGAAEGCDAVLHIAGIVDEVPPEITFENINLGGTRRIVEEAERAGVGRLVYVSSLGVDRGSSDYHRSKAAGEEIARGFSGDWVVCRPGNVYGPGDEVVSLLLKMVRTLPVVPVIGGGDQPFQPIAAGDLGIALALALEPDAPARQVLELAGGEQVTMSELLDLLETITDMHPARMPIPEVMATAGAELAEWVGMEIPIKSDQIIMLLEGNVIPADRVNALTEVFGVTPRPLAEGLQALADSQPEKLPSEGVGRLHRQRYWADVRGSSMGAEELFQTFLREFGSLVPEGLLEVGAEPGTPVVLEEGATLTLSVPLRGHIQVRVEEVVDRTVTCATLAGHHLAGIIRYFVEERPGGEIRFEVRSYSRASRLLDAVGMVTLGHWLQRETWERLVEEVVERSGGEAEAGLQSEEGALSDEEAKGVERWTEKLVITRRREQESAS